MVVHGQDRLCAAVEPLTTRVARMAVLRAVLGKTLWCYFLGLVRLRASSSTADTTLMKPFSSSAVTRRPMASSRSMRCRWTRFAVCMPLAVGVITNVRRSVAPTSRVIKPRSASRSRMLVSVERLCARPRCSSAIVAGAEVASSARMCASPCDRPSSRRSAR